MKQYELHIGCESLCETEKAVCLTINQGWGHGQYKHWLPKSQISMTTNENGWTTMVVPAWLLKDIRSDLHRIVGINELIEK